MGSAKLIMLGVSLNVWLLGMQLASASAVAVCAFVRGSAEGFASVWRDWVHDLLFVDWYGTGHVRTWPSTVPTGPVCRAFRGLKLVVPAWMGRRWSGDWRTTVVWDSTDC